MTAEVLRDCARFGLLEKGDSVIVALSGGADSVALLRFLDSVKEEYELTLCAAHLHHGIRGEEADRDEEFCKILCKKYNIPIFIRHRDIPSLSRERGVSEELCGRQERYAFFEELANERHAKIALAHTASDNAETLIFNLSRGASVNGAAAIPPKRGRVIRPLISRTRAEIEKYCAENGLDYMTDSTNLSDDYTRNKLRHNVIPVLRSINPNLEAAMLRFSRDAAEVSDYMERQARTALSDARADSGYRAERLLQNDIAVLKTAINILIKKYNIMPTHRRIDCVLAVLQNGGAVELDKSVTLVCDRGLLRKKEAAVAADECAVDRPQCFFCGGSKYFITADDSFLENKALVLRNRREGDVFSFQKRNITKPLGKALREAGIPSEQRGGVLCLCEGSEVLWCEPLGWSRQGNIYRKNHNLSIEKHQ